MSHYTMFYKYGKHVRMIFWVRFYFYFSLDSFLYFGGISNKTIDHFQYIKIQPQTIALSMRL